MSRFVPLAEPHEPRCGIMRDEFGRALVLKYPAGGEWIPLAEPHEPRPLPLSGIDLGKFFDRATTISKDASPLERQLIGAIPGVVGLVGNLVVPGIGSAAGGVAGKLIHESSGYNPNANAAPAQVPIANLPPPRAADDLGVPLLAALVLAAVWILTE